MHKMHSIIETEHQKYYNELIAHKLNPFKILIAQWNKLEEMAKSLGLHLTDNYRLGSTESKRNKLLNFNQIKVENITQRLEDFANQLQAEITKQKIVYETVVRTTPDSLIPETARNKTTASCATKLAELTKSENEFDEIKSLIALSEKALLLDLNVRFVDLPQCHLDKREAAHAREKRIAAIVRPQEKRENNNNNNNNNNVNNNAVVSSNAPPPPPLPPADYFQEKKYTIKIKGRSLNNNNVDGSRDALIAQIKKQELKDRTAAINEIEEKRLKRNSEAHEEGVASKNNNHLAALSDAVKNQGERNVADIEGKFNKSSLSDNNNAPGYFFGVTLRSTQQKDGENNDAQDKQMHGESQSVLFSLKKSDNNNQPRQLEVKKPSELEERFALNSTTEENKRPLM